VFRIGFVCLYSGIDLPELNSEENMCVRDHLRMFLPKNLSGHKIDRISDIDYPDDDKVADVLFHRNNFKPDKHQLVVKLHTII